MTQKVHTEPHHTCKLSLTNFVSQHQLPINSTLASLGRKSVPIKQYSNKFFRDLEADHHHLLSTHSETPTLQQPKKVNTLIRKKQMFGRQQSIKESRQTSSFSKHK